jgi:trimeric autotransporter adhesin
MKHVTFHLPSFLRRVRIHGGEFDSSARAMNRVSEESSLMTYESAIHAQADLRIVRGSTIERKHMSTKTTFKRIALVAVAALGFGVLSVVPSQADVTGLIVTTTNGTGATVLKTGESTTAATIKVQFLGLATADTVSVTIAAGLGNPSTANLAGAGLWFTESTTSRAGNNHPTVDTATTLTAAAGTGPITVREPITPGSYFRMIAPQGTANGTYSVTMKYSLGETTTSTVPAGTYSFNAVVNSVQGGVVTNTVHPFTITVAATPVVVVTPAAANAKAFLHAGNAEFPATKLADSVTAGSNLPGTRIGTLRVSNFSTGDIAARDTITVTMTGVGFLTTTNLASNITGRSFVVANTDSLTANIMPDGASGTGTITITTAAGASFVKTVTFFDTRPTTASAVVAKAFIKAGATTNDVFAVTVRDSLGNAITDGGVTVSAAPSDTRTTQVVGSATAATCTWNVAGSAYHCPITGAAADKFGPVAYTITATGTGTHTAVRVTTTATVTFADNVATKAVLAGPATGTPGATVEYTLTLTEKNGYPVADQTYGAGGAGGALFSTTAADTDLSGFTGTGAALPFSPSESFTSKSGVITSKGTLPIAGVATGSWTLIGDGFTTSGAIDKTIGKTKVTVSTDVANPGVDAATDAANEATDAANAATDAALAAAEAADAATSAAQEASDAVAALSESVTKLIAGLQAQIKSLAAVVAKIAKKVKA